MKKLFSLLFVLFLTSCFVETSPEPYPSYLLPSGFVVEDCGCLYYPSEIGKVLEDYYCGSGQSEIGMCYTCCDWTQYDYVKCSTPATYRYCL